MLRGIGRLRTGPINPEASILIANMTTAPSSARAVLIASTISQLKGSGVWAKLDALYITAAHDSQAARLNWKNPGTWTLVGTNSPAFTTDRGYKGDGASSYLTADSYNPALGGGNYLQDSAVIGCWIQQAPTTASSIVFATGLAFIQTNGAVSNYFVRVNDGTNALMSPAFIGTGHIAARRLSASGKDIWKNGAQYNTVDSSASTAVGGTVTLLATSVPGAYCNASVSAAYTSGGLTDAEMAAMHQSLNSYMQSVGVS